MNKLLITSMSLSLVVLFTSNNNFTNANAALTAPSSYDLAYVFVDNPSPAPDYFALIAPLYELNGFDIPYTRTSDGSYFNYTTTLDNDLSDRIPLGLEITQTFNRSNTSWSGTTGGYVPTSSTIGSDNTVGSRKPWVFSFDNQTNKNYELYLDFSSSPINANYQWFLSYNGTPFQTYVTVIRSITDTLFRIYIPSYTTLSLERITNSLADYFDAWYLKDLGVSASYTEGYLDGDADGFEDGFDLGYEDGLIDGFQDGLEALEDSTAGLFDILGNVFGAVGTVFGIYVLPGINIGMLVFIPLIFTLLLFILKILRGGS